MSHLNMESKMKSWVQELYEEFNFYDYKGKKVIAKTENEKMNIANKHKPLSDQRQKEALKDNVLIVPESLFILMSDSEESIDQKIIQDKKDKEELKKQISKSYITTSRKPKRKDIDNDIKSSVLNFVANNKVKKNHLIKAMKEHHSSLSQNTVKRVIRKLFKERLIEIDKTFKTKPFVVKGKYWREV